MFVGIVSHEIDPNAVIDGAVSQVYQVCLIQAKTLEEAQQEFDAYVHHNFPAYINGDIEGELEWSVKPLELSKHGHVTSLN